MRQWDQAISKLLQKASKICNLLQINEIKRCNLLQSISRTSILLCCLFSFLRQKADSTDICKVFKVPGREKSKSSLIWDCEDKTLYCKIMKYLGTHINTQLCVLLRQPEVVICLLKLSNPGCLNTERSLTSQEIG